MAYSLSGVMVHLAVLVPGIPAVNAKMVQVGGMGVNTVLGAESRNVLEEELIVEHLLLHAGKSVASIPVIIGKNCINFVVTNSDEIFVFHIVGKVLGVFLFGITRSLNHEVFS